MTEREQHGDIPSSPPSGVAGPIGAEQSSAGAETLEDDRLRELVRGALATTGSEVPDVLRGVQRKLRQRSGGKFYTDGWSTSRQPPIQTYLITSLVMLAITLLVYLVLTPRTWLPRDLTGPGSLPSSSHRFRPGSGP